MPTPVVGREIESHVVRQLLAGCADGPAGLVIEGDPGIGKTTVWSGAIARSAEVRPLSVDPAVAGGGEEGDRSCQAPCRERDGTSRRSTATWAVLDRPPAGNSTTPEPRKRIPSGAGVPTSGTQVRAVAGCR